MNFTNSPFERMMKEVPYPGRSGGNPCDGCHDQPKRCKKKFRALIVEPSRTSGQVGPKS